MKIINLFFVTIIWWSVQGCNIVNPPEDIPTYIHIDSFTFNNPDPLRTGSASHAIGSVWVYYNNSSIGVFDLPADVPVIAKGRGALQIAPGVTQNGLQSYQGAYPYYLMDTFAFDAAPTQTFHHKPQTQYIQSALFPWMEDFETASKFTPLTTDGINIIPVDGSDPYMGTKYGLISLPNAGDSTEVISQIAFDKPSSATFCELDYKSDVTVYMGLVAVTSTTAYSPYYIIALKPNAEWKKIYINLATYMGNNPALKYYVVLKAALPAGQQSGYAAFDNIKIVTD